ncbi:hypothetical protein Vadar_007968 [Vaccinium darrowii]|uniref:Uncharacterized protein n=1 Tax=Vaccinium darrowii TaxID=229202 RepID=A0ACB7XP43_9ERIC|nr:hypothetical protein Vadar_007968 [Vaccinium darrowii]
MRERLLIWSWEFFGYYLAELSLLHCNVSFKIYSRTKVASFGKAEPETAQMTIFYAGRVILFNDLSADKEKEVMLLASKEAAIVTISFWPRHCNSLTQHIRNAYIKLKLNLTATKNRTSRVYRNKKPKWKETIKFDVNDKKLSNGNMRKKQFLGRVKLFGSQFKRKGEEGLVDYQLEKS